MLKLYNTLTRKKEEFKPINPPHVGLYTCGPTVYDYAHIGNLRTYITEDILKRVITANGYQMNHVMNITDVGHLTSDADEGEDKMMKGARREGKTVWEIAAYYTDAFKEDLKSLNIIEPNIWCKATDHIKEQIELIQKLEQKGFTYVAGDGVYFDTSKFPHYGALARLDIEGLRAGARIEMVKGKRNPTDFALWKFSHDADQRRSKTQINADNEKHHKRLMEWPSPWGIGFPGWHIECSAMSMKYLGETFDIHAGGIDHIPVHHTNEIAQAEAATGKPLARWWVHGEFLQINEGRMGKSEGNLLRLQTLIDKGYDPLIYRYFTFTAHYRQKLNFSWEALDAAATALKNLKETTALLDEPKIGCAEYEQRFMDAINDDLNLPQALSVVWDLIKSDYPAAAKKASLLKFDAILGLDLAHAVSARIDLKDLPEDIRELVAQRELLRQQKKFADADVLRKTLTAKGYIIEDTPEGQVIKRK
ncbi:MAG: cysteine--tRNA ligase [Patescibacteria group bacterium]